MAVKHKPTSVKSDKERRLQQERVNAAPDDVDALKAENKLLKAQNTALSDNQSFLEDCIAEMAGIVYAE